MQRHFHEELDALKQTLLAMGGLVEDQIRRVMRALIDRDSDLAQEVIDRDRQVNAYDVEIDEKCVELLALHQPTAGDLRFITTTLKIVTDIERIGDQAVNIAQRAVELNREPQLKPYVDLPTIWGWAFVTLGAGGLAAAYCAWGLAPDRVQGPAREAIADVIGASVGRAASTAPE